MVTLMCMNSLRRLSLGLIARKPKTPRATPNHVGISAVGWHTAGAQIAGQAKNNQQKRKNQCDLRHRMLPSQYIVRIPVAWMSQTAVAMRKSVAGILTNWPRSDPNMRKAVLSMDQS